MREQFPWFLDPTEDELQRLWGEATFSFDANVLLNLYRVDRETTEDYFKIFRALGDRIFLPHEAANQFFLNRREVIRTEQNSFSEAKKRVRDWVKRRKGFDNLKHQLRGGDGDDSIGDIIEDEIKDEIENVFDGSEDYEQAIEAVKDALIERIENLEERFTPTGTTRANAKEDEILRELVEIFEGRTGDELEGDMEDLKDEAQERYDSKQPPGYLDYDEDEGGISRGECEDFLIWKQLMEYAGREGEDVVFITGEKKEDWWEVDREHDIVRPTHELLREFRRKTAQTFWMFSTEHLIENASERLGLDVRDKSVEQTDKVSQKGITSKTVLRLSEKKRRKNEIEKARKLREVAESIEERAEEVSNMKAYAAGGVVEGAQAKASIAEDKIRNEVMRALSLSDELRSPNTENTIREHLRKLFHATATRSEEAVMSNAGDLVIYLETVAETLRREAEELGGSEAFVSSATETGA